MSQSEQREEAVFEAALKLSAAERTAYLDHACAADPELRGRVERLLASFERAGGFMNHPATPERNLRLSPGPTEKPGDRIGRYKLLEQIGEGGCGVVYMAEQEEPIRRKVALKVIKLGMDTKQVIARFEAERQALALMDHPNIAKVLDAGATDTGRPYFVMELVRGIRITEYCDQNQLPTAERLKLFTQVCQAIQHAHQKGIIHRDIKPSNILVTVNDGVPVPKVIDFGIAKATQGRLTDHTLFTAFEQFLGTPAYMSPEQAMMTGLDIDTRSDIYSLGVLLYELLTGQTPFDQKELLAAGLDAMRRTIREKEPPKPSTRLSTMLNAELMSVAQHQRAEPSRLLHTMRGDLDWIVMKALEKDRARRYETANGLATDVQRHLNNEPVAARPPSKLYEFQKTVRRHKVGFAATAVIIIVLAVGVLVSAWQAVRARAAEKKAAETLAQVAAERDAKEQALKNAETISTFLNDVFRSPDPSRDGRTITVAETLDMAVKKLETSLTNQPDQKAKLQETLAGTYFALGLYREAIPLEEKLYDYDLKNLGAENTNTLRAMGNLAFTYADAGRKEEALKLSEQVLALDRKVLGPENTNTLRAMGSLAYSYWLNGRRDKTLKLREQELALDRKVLGPEHPNTIMVMGNLANSYWGAGRNDEALKLNEQVLTLDRKVFGPEHPSTLVTMGNLAESYNDAGREEEALKLSEQVLALDRKVLGPMHPETLRVMRDAADHYAKAGRKEEAIKLSEQVLALYRKALGPEHPSTLMAMGNLARYYDEAGRMDEALKMFEPALTLCRKVLGPEHPDTLTVMQNLANAYDDAGRKEEALKLREQVLALDRKVLGPEHPATLMAMGNLADSYADAGRKDEALKLREQVLALDRKVLGPEHSDTLGTMISLADDYYAAGRPADAEPLYRETLEALKQATPTHELVVHLGALADTLGHQGRLTEAEPIYRAGLNFCRQFAVNDGEEHQWLASGLGALLRSQKKWVEAEPFYREAVTNAAALWPNDFPKWEWQFNELVDVLQHQGKTNEIERLKDTYLTGRRPVTAH